MTDRWMDDGRTDGQTHRKTRGPRATIRSPANCANGELLEIDYGKKK